MEYKNEAFYLIDNRKMCVYTRGVRHVPSSWNYENRFSKEPDITGSTTNVLDGTQSDGYVSINRNFKTQSDGTLVLRTAVNVSNTSDGMRIYFANSLGQNVLEICTFDGFYHVMASENVNTGIRSCVGDVMEFKFTVGKSEAQVNGNSVRLKRAFGTYDHVPTLPLKFILDNSGIDYKINGTDISVFIRKNNHKNDMEEM